jgi:hypothetical protein
VLGWEFDHAWNPSVATCRTSRQSNAEDFNARTLGEYGTEPEKA